MLANAVALTGSSKQITGLSGYSQYIIVFTAATMTATGNVAMTINNDSTAGRYFRSDPGASNGNVNLKNTGAGSAYYFSVVVMGDASSMKSIQYELNGAYNQLGAITSMEFIAVGTTWSAGTVSIYGKA